MKTLEVYKWNGFDYRHVRTIELKKSETKRGKFHNAIGISGLGVKHSDLFTGVEVTYLGIQGSRLLAYVTGKK